MSDMSADLPEMMAVLCCCLDLFQNGCLVLGMLGGLGAGGGVTYLIELIVYGTYLLTYALAAAALFELLLAAAADFELLIRINFYNY